MEAVKGILLAGFGWICSGAVILITLYVEEARGINLADPYAALGLAAFVVVLGAIILVSRKKINNIIDSKHNRVANRQGVVR